MSARTLTDRNIRGLIFTSLIEAPMPNWIPDLSSGDPYSTDQFQENYRWLSDTPALRKWDGGRHAKTLTDLGIQVINDPFEATIQMRRVDMIFEKLGQHRQRITDLGLRYNTHWGKLFTDLLTFNSGAGPIGYDGVALFSASHVEDESGTQSNLSTTDITTVANPTADEMRGGILAAVTQLTTLKDGAGEPINEAMSKVRVIVPPAFLGATVAALKGEMIAGGGAFKSNELPLMDNMTFSYSVNPRLSAAGGVFFVARADSPIPTLIRQQMSESGTLAPHYSQKGEGSEYEHDTGQREYGIDCWRGVAPGRWQQIIRHTFT